VERIPPPAQGSRRRVKIVDVELSAPLSPIEGNGWTDAHVLVRMHGQAIGTVDLEFATGFVTPDALEAVVHDRLGEAVRRHLHDDGIAEPKQGPRSGLRHPCQERVRPGPSAPLVSVVVPTRDRADELAACLESMRRLEYPAFEVIVVDNAPSDDSSEAMVRERFGDDHRIRYLFEARAGAALARNIGARNSRGKFVAFTDDDAEVDPLWLAALVDGFRRGPRVVCVAGLTLPSALGTPAQQAFEVYGGMGLGFEPRVYDLLRNRGDTLLYPYTAGIFGASNNVALRKEEFLERGGFDVALGPGTPAFGAEDLDLFLALILDGWQIAYQPTAIVRHAHRAEFSELYWQVFTYSAGMTVLLTKWALSDRHVAVDLARRVPGLIPAALLRPHRSGAEAGVGAYLTQLRWLERAGYLYGPVAYLRSRLAERTRRRAGFDKLALGVTGRPQR
jgi:glycosyltransferase involved in cell wall biosynthesis